MSNPVAPRLKTLSYLSPPALQDSSSRTRLPREGTAIERISLELSRQCNLRCAFCYSQADESPRRGLRDDEIREIVDEAVQAGARLISIVGGGETLLRKSLLRDGESVIDYANGQGCYCFLYTNCTLVDRKASDWLFGRDVAVIGKLTSLREDVQDRLLGVSGSSQKLRRGIDHLIDAGLSSGQRRLGLETVICKANYEEIPDIWRFMRERGIIPEVEIATMHGRALDNQRELFFEEEEASEKYRQLFEEILKIDREEYGFDWAPRPPFIGGSCKLYYSNCYINDRGGVQPCAGVDKEYGWLRVGERKAQGQDLLSIVSGPEFQKLRKVHEHIEGACRSCEHLEQCYGCRAAAWHKTGNIFAEDPVCWNKGCAGKVPSGGQVSGED